nr:helix-turn-helix transcriptional regulator [uncultured Gemmiger sp.]
MPENCAAIIDSLIEQRHKLGMTQNDLAKAAQVQQSVIARFESKKAIPQLNTLLKVAAALGCSLQVVPLIGQGDFHSCAVTK